MIPNLTKLFFIFILLLTFGCGINSSSNAPIKRVITYNIRYDNPKDNLNNWDNRKKELVELINHYTPQVFGIQEGLLHQLKYMDQHLPNFSRIGVGRNDGITSGEFTAIYYNHNEFKVLEESTFWLTEKEQIISVGWDAALERICTYGLFEHQKSKQKIYIFNTHYDHIGKIARVKSSELILNKIKEINKNDYPLILMGDFNSEPGNDPIETLKKVLDDGADLAENGINGPFGTYTGFKKNAIPERRIDYIFVKNLAISKYSHIADKRKDGYYISDHLPVLIEIQE